MTGETPYTCDVITILDLVNKLVLGHTSVTIFINVLVEDRNAEPFLSTECFELDLDDVELLMMWDLVTQSG